MSTTTLNPLCIAADIFRMPDQLIKRNVLLRYRDALFSLLWIFLSPLIMLAIFAFIFDHIFQARWPKQDTDTPFWLLLYSGLIAFNLFAETISRAPTSVRSQPSFVEKIISIASLISLLSKSKKLQSSEKQNQKLRSSPLGSEIAVLRTEIIRVKSIVPCQITKLLRLARKIIGLILSGTNRS